MKMREINPNRICPKCKKPLLYQREKTDLKFSADCSTAQVIKREYWVCLKCNKWFEVKV